LSCAGTVIAYNEWTADRIRPYNSDVRIAPAGVNTDVFFPRPKQRARPTVTLVPGRVSEVHKGRYFLAEVMRAMETARPVMVFHITVTRSGFQGKNVVEVGWLNQEDLPDLYQSADIAFVPSLWPEPQGIVALEASACGLLVVATSVGGLKELVLNHQSGYLVRPGDVRGTVDILCKLRDDPDLRVELGECGRQRCLDERHWDAIFKRHYLPLFASARME